MNIEGQEAPVLGVLPVGAVGGAVGEDGLEARGDGVQVALDGRPDAVLGEQRILSARHHEPLLAPQAKAQTVAMAYLIPLVLHEQKEVAQVVGVLHGLPQIRIQHGAIGGLAPGLPEPFDVADRFGWLTLQNHGQPVLPAQLV